MKQLNLHVVGADHPNANGSNRRFEILLCAPGETIELVPEPRNPFDPNAVAVFSVRGVQIGYLSAERAPWIGSLMRSGREIQAIYQQATQMGAAVRIAFDGGTPVLPTAMPPPQPQAPTSDDGFWPDYVPSDD